ncbi:hypothetical protein D3C81_2028570 [compost metagenome]
MVVKGPEIQILELIGQRILPDEISQINQALRAHIWLNFRSTEQNKHIWRGASNHLVLQLLITVQRLI